MRHTIGITPDELKSRDLAWASLDDARLDELCERHRLVYESTKGCWFSWKDAESCVSYFRGRVLELRAKYPHVANQNLPIPGLIEAR